MDLWECGQRVASSYARNPKVAAVIVAGSVGRGRSDAHSDLEVDVYWATPPTDEDRRGSSERAGGRLTTLWDYDPEDAEWSDDFVVEGTPTSVSNFTTSEIESILDRQPVLTVKDQMRLSAIHEGRPVSGQALARTWAARSPYTDETRLVALKNALAAMPADRWRQVPALASRGDLIMLRLAGDDMVLALLRLWFGLNRRYVEHPRFKWGFSVASSFECLPRDGIERLRGVCLADPATGCDIASGVLRDTLDLIDANVPALETAELRQRLATPRLAS